MSTGYTYGDKPPIENCPYCNHPTEADFVDIGVGMTQCGPYHCTRCYASEIGPFDKPRELTEREKQTCWYAPESEPGSSANVINGVVVSANVMDQVYRAEYTNNPNHGVPGHVEQWRDRIRRKTELNKEYGPISKKEPPQCL